LGSSSAVLTLFIIAAILITSIVPTLYLLIRQSDRARQSAVADTCAATLAVQPRTDGETWALLEGLRKRYDLSSIEYQPREGAPVRIGASVAGQRERRKVGDGLLLVTFRSEMPAQLLFTLRIAAIAAVTAAATGAILLAIQARELVHAGAGADPTAGDPDGTSTSYLINTFGSSLKTLKSRENELTRLHQQQKERADEVARLSATLVRSLNSGFIALDEHGRIVDLNQSAWELLSVRPQERVTTRALVDALGSSQFTELLADACRNRLALQRQEVATGGESPRLIGLTTVPLLDPQDRYLGMMALFADLTPIRDLEQRIRELQSLADLGEMSAGIAHEFRNSLSTILGYLRLAQRGRNSSETVERVQSAEREAALLARAVESLLVFARPVDLSVDEVDLLDLARSTADRLTTEADGIEVRVEGERATIEGDRSLLGRAIENVFRNAIDAVREARSSDGRIRIEIRATPFPAITVADNGSGLDEARSARLFVPFQSTKPHGFGLGLALTRKIVLVHGGTIRLQGAPGKGATATIEFANAPLSIAEHGRANRYFS
jgi:signal transduction histidine kinase